MLADAFWCPCALVVILRLKGMTALPNKMRFLVKSIILTNVLPTLFDKRLNSNTIFIVPSSLGIILIEVGTLPNKKSIVLNEMSIVLNEIGIVLNKVGIVLNKMGIIPNKKGAMLNEIVLPFICANL